MSCYVIQLPNSLSHLFQLYRGGQFYWWRKPEDPKKTTDLRQVTDKLKLYNMTIYIYIYIVYIVMIFCLSCTKCHCQHWNRHSLVYHNNWQLVEMMETELQNDVVYHRRFCNKYIYNEHLLLFKNIINIKKKKQLYRLAVLIGRKPSWALKLEIIQLCLTPSIDNSTIVFTF